MMADLSEEADGGWGARSGGGVGWGEGSQQSLTVFLARGWTTYIRVPCEFRLRQGAESCGSLGRR